MTEKTSNTLHGSGMRQFCNDINFCLINLNPGLRNLMAKDYALPLTYKWHFPNLGTRLVVFTPLEHFCLLRKRARGERITEDREIIHEDFHGFLNHIVKDCNHTPLERARCIA
ncbi:hypothetical protein Tco_0040881 [Tanacetum coccineum]